jgi:hypothetical protein
MADRVTMRHPETGATQDVSRDAFELTWRSKGFEEIISGGETDDDELARPTASTSSSWTPSSSLNA